MSKYFKTINANGPIRAGKYEVQFDACFQDGDHWTGVFEADTEEGRMAMLQIMAKRKSVSEISLEEFNAIKAKKKQTPFLRPFDPMKITRLQPNAERAANPSPDSESVEATSTLTAAEVTKVGKVAPSQPEDAPPRSKKSTTN